mmetsp:Transcript_19994/g.32795  ORF Transcript_19994/g.32795 Transcript_19994/m.32795 type:complete len:131 (+) Transcript_19994:145-537(+)
MLRDRSRDPPNARSSLFGNVGGAGYNRVPTSQQQASEQLLEQDNDREIADLSSKVSVLKNLTIDINREVNEQNSFLDNMDGQFSGVGNILKGTMNKLNEMVKTKSSQHLCYLALFIVGVVLFLYYLFRQS